MVPKEGIISLTEDEILEKNSLEDEGSLLEDLEEVVCSYQ